MTCKHYWLIDSNNIATCKFCGATKQELAYYEADDYKPISAEDRKRKVQATREIAKLKEYYRLVQIYE